MPEGVLDCPTYALLIFEICPSSFRVHSVFNLDHTMPLVVGKTLWLTCGHSRPFSLLHPCFIRAFAGCTGLEKINIPESVRLLEEGCFSGCLALKELHIPANTGLNGRAFIGLPPETKITIDEGNAACIDGDAICSKDGQRFIRLRSDVEEFQVKDGVKIIEWSAFYPCTKLKKLVLPASIEKIDDFAFGGCISLTTIVVGSEAVRSLVEEYKKKERRHL